MDTTEPLRWGLWQTTSKLVQNRVQTGEFRADSRFAGLARMVDGRETSQCSTSRPDIATSPRNKAEVAELNANSQTWLKNKPLEIETRPDDKAGKEISLSPARLETSPTDGLS